MRRRRKSWWRIAFAGALLAPASWATAQGPSLSCLEALAISGEGSLGEQVRAALAVGPLASVPAQACEGVALEVGADLHARMTQGERRVEHHAESPEVLASWVESWLVPPPVDRGTAPAPAAEEETVEEPVDPEPQDDAQTEPQAEDSRRTPLRLSLGASVDTDTMGLIWPGGEFGLFAVLAPQFWLGVGMGAAWQIEREDTDRRVLRMAVRTGWGGQYDWGELRFGGGIGIVSADAERRVIDPNTNEPLVTSDEAAGPIIELLGSVGINFGRRAAVFFEVVGRFLVPDELGGSNDPLDDPYEALEPEAMADFMGSLVVGLSWYRVKRP